jgi:hypothetical protein
MSYDTYYACLTCISNETWSLGTVCCKKCRLEHDNTHTMKQYKLSISDDRCNVCNNTVQIGTNTNKVKNEICNKIENRCD